VRDSVSVMSSHPSSEGSRASNWAAFVVALFFTLGCLNLIDGVAALSKDSNFRVDSLLFGSLSFWATVYLIIGALQLLTAWLIWRGSYAGSLIGMCLVGVNALITLLTVGAYPLWSIIILVGDGVVIYALTVYGDAFRTSRR
jgi:hypothetical protein